MTDIDIDKDLANYSAKLAIVLAIIIIPIFMCCCCCTKAIMSGDDDDDKKSDKRNSKTISVRTIKYNKRFNDSVIDKQRNATKNDEEIKADEKKNKEKEKLEKNNKSWFSNMCSCFSNPNTGDTSQPVNSANSTNSTKTNTGISTANLLVKQKTDYEPDLEKGISNTNANTDNGAGVSIVVTPNTNTDNNSQNESAQLTTTLITTTTTTTTNIPANTPKVNKKKYLYYIFDTWACNYKLKQLTHFAHEPSFKNVFDELEYFVNLVLKVYSSEDYEILLQISSPGGDADKFIHAYSNLMRLRKAKFVITALVDDMAASGGYLLACACNTIVASEYAQIGSVGVIASVVNYANAAEKLGIETKTFTTGPYKETFPVASKYTDDDVKKTNEVINDTLEVFKSIVSKARTLSDTEIQTVVSARVWFGTKAKENKLIDQIELSDEYIEDLIKREHDIFVIYLENQKDGKSSKFKLFKLLTDNIDACADKIQELRHRITAHTYVCNR